MWSKWLITLLDWDWEMLSVYGNSATDGYRISVNNQEHYVSLGLNSNALFKWFCILCPLCTKLDKFLACCIYVKSAVYTHCRCHCIQFCGARLQQIVIPRLYCLCRHFYLAWYMLSSCVRLSVCLSVRLPQAGTVPKWRNAWSRKQRHTITNNPGILLFWRRKISAKFQQGHPNGAPNRVGVGSNKGFWTIISLYFKYSAR